MLIVCFTSQQYLNQKNDRYYGYAFTGRNINIKMERKTTRRPSSNHRRAYFNPLTALNRYLSSYVRFYLPAARDPQLNLQY